MKNLPYDLILRRSATVLAVVTLTLSLLATFTGILLAFYYEPAAGRAYNSLKTIATEVPNGVLIRSLHDIAGNGMIVIALLEIVIMFLGRKFSPSWLTAWISGILLTLTGIGLGWTAMILGWTQLGYWRFKIELGSIEAIPLIGPMLRNILIGGESVNTTTVEHLYTLHSYVLSIGAVGLAIAHLAALIYASKLPAPEEVSVEPDLEGSGVLDG